jgi:hypothetical protein
MEKFNFGISNFNLEVSNFKLEVAGLYSIFWEKFFYFNALLHVPDKLGEM